ncbi:MAG: hypothetical protein AAGC76_09620 [Luteibacter sp.]|uniref:hypothetical protein n=1 Tax=Luteibacter sp. TaxID=1886636 RepID=UPI0028097135|nr:hypothetical protein [Luteibacter sp.]MDQ7996099.1 hypothetical protein [Luteibacter sp.]
MNVDAIKAQADALQAARNRLKTAREKLAAVRAHNGQNGYSVTVNGVDIRVSNMDPHSYQGKLIRGREMIHLGAIKAIEAFVDHCEQKAREEAEKLRTLIDNGVIA